MNNLPVSTQKVFESGTVLAGRYQVIELLGAGAMGWVFKVKDLSLSEQTIALKLLYPHLVLSEDAVNRFHSEILITRELSHPHITQTYTFEQASSQEYFITMELVEGSTLTASISDAAENKLKLEEKLRIVYEIASGMAFAHRRKVIHRDLKPDNILLTLDNEVKIGDFGIAQALKQLSDNSSDGRVLGTPYYMSPEQFRSEVLDERSDVYSFGILAYQIMFAELPFNAPSLYDLALLHQTTPISISQTQRASVPSWCLELLETCTEKEVEKRFSTMTKVRDFIAKKLNIKIDEIELELEQKEEKEPRQDYIAVPKHLKKEDVPFYRVGILAFFFILIPIIISGSYFTKNPEWFFAAYTATALFVATLFKPRIRQKLLFLITVVILMYLAHNNPSTRKRAVLPVLALEHELNIDLMPLKMFLKTPYRIDNQEDLIKSIQLEQRFHKTWSLLLAGADVNGVNSRGETALHVYANGNNITWTNKLVLRYGARIDIPDINGDTALHIFARKGNLFKTIDNYFNRVKNASFRYDPTFPISITIRRWIKKIGGKGGVISPDNLIIKDNENINLDIKNNNGETPLFLALKNKNYDTTAILLKYGANSNQNVNKKQDSLLHFSVELQNIPLVSLLLSKQADINIKNRLGETSLHRAVDSNPNGQHYKQIITMLLEHGASTNVKNNKEVSPLMLAIAQNKMAAVALLSENK